MTNTGERNLIYLAAGGVKRFTTAGSTVSGDYRAIYFCRNTQLTSLTCTDITNAAGISSKTSFAAGTCLQGAISKVKVKGGAIFLIN